MVMPTACYDPATGDLLGIERGLLAIYNDLNALSTAQKNAIWADFTGGTPAKWSTDLGPHADAVSALSIPAIVMHTSTAFMGGQPSLYLTQVPAFRTRDGLPFFR
jgi:hypothetical protein